MQESEAHDYRQQIENWKSRPCFADVVWGNVKGEARRDEEWEVGGAGAKAIPWIECGRQSLRGGQSRVHGRVVSSQPWLSAGTKRRRRRKRVLAIEKGRAKPAMRCCVCREQ